MLVAGVYTYLDRLDVAVLPVCNLDCERSIRIFCCSSGFEQLTCSIFGSWHQRFSRAAYYCNRHKLLSSLSLYFWQMPEWLTPSVPDVPNTPEGGRNNPHRFSALQAMRQAALLKRLVVLFAHVGWNLWALVPALPLPSGIFNGHRRARDERSIPR